MSVIDELRKLDTGRVRRHALSSDEGDLLADALPKLLDALQATQDLLNRVTYLEGDQAGDAHLRVVEAFERLENDQPKGEA